VVAVSGWSRAWRAWRGSLGVGRGLWGSGEPRVGVTRCSGVPILRVHPFADGNHRTSFVALSSALWSFGLPNLRFGDDAEMIAHDDAVTRALLSDTGDVEPFAQLLAERIEGGRKEPT
jgi:hypothetical protein